MADAYFEIRRQQEGRQPLNVEASLQSFDRRLSALFDRVCKLEDGRDGLGTSDALPAQTPTEDQIVAALKADPAMAGRVMAKLAYQTCGSNRNAMGAAAKSFVIAGGLISTRGIALQSLAVALAAASYRG